MSTSSAPSTSSHSPAPRRATPEGRRERLRRILLDRLQAERRTYPATAGQRALWLYQQLNPGSAAYNLRFCTRVTGGLRHDDLVSAINRAMRRRPALRSRFRLVEDSLGTEVVDGLTAADTLTDGTGWSEEDIHSHLDARSMEPFDLETGPLLRVDCVRRGEDLYAMVTVHHIVADMWSLGLLLDDVLAELGAGAPAARPEDLDYSTHARAEAAWIPSGGADRARAYWDQRLAGSPTPVSLSPSPRPSGRARAVRSTAFGLGRDLSEAVRRVGREQGTTPFVVLLAAAAVVMHHRTGTGHLVFGSASVGRDAPGSEGTAGYFTTPLPVVAQVDDSESFAHLLRRMQTDFAHDLEHSRLPYPQIVARVAPNQDPSFISTSVVMESTSGSGRSLLAFAHGGKADPLIAGHFVLHPFAPREGSADQELVWFIEYDGHEYRCALQHDTASIPEPLAHLISEEIRTVLAVACRRPEVEIGRISLLRPQEQVALLRPTSLPDPAPETFPDAVRRWAIEQGGQTALVDSAHELSYADLVDRAQDVAERISGLGLTHGARIGVCLDGSAEAVVILLGVMMAGHAFVPLDPGYPASRIAYIVQDARISLFLGRGIAVEALAGIGVLTPSDLVDRAAAPCRSPGPDDVAYLCYTSGSTGRPKGVIVEHRNLAYLIRAVGALHSSLDGGRPAAPRRVLQFSAPAFDAAVWELATGLALGNTLVVVPRDRRLPGQPLIATVREFGVTSIIMPPSALATLEPDDVPGLVEVCSAGESLTQEVVDRWAVDGRVLLNVYGPTECTVAASVTGPVRPGQIISIGGALLGADLYVLDARMRPVPPGAVGELYIGGNGVARGYQNQETETARRFIRHPADSDRRIYASGDVVRRGLNGELEYLGRVDNQVKIRGFRVEPGEIEHALEQLPGVRGAVVVPRSAGDEHAHLSGFVTGRADAALDEEDLRRQLAEALPAYMVPNRVRVVEEFPLSAHGKIDRRALEELADTGPSSRQLPRGPAEAAVAGVWREVLGVDEVSRDDNFFALGGNSLLALQVRARLTRATGSELPVETFFEASRLSDLARRLEAEDTGSAQPVPAPADTEPASDDRLSYAQLRLWFQHQLDPHDRSYNIIEGLTLEGPADVETLDLACREVVERHEALRTMIELGPAGPIRRVRARTSELGGHGAVDVRQVDDDGRAELLDVLSRPFDLAQEAVRFGIVRHGADGAELYVSAHHAVSDGTGVECILEDIGRIYSSLVAGQELPAPDAAPYSAHVARQRALVESGRLDGRIDALVERLRGRCSPVSLPSGRAAADDPGRVDTHLSVEQDAVLRRSASHQGTTVPVMVLTALQIVVSRWSGHDDFAVGVPLVGRSGTRFERTVGMFVNALPVPSVTGDAGTARQAVQLTRERLVGALADQDVPFETLLERLEPERDPSRPPLFQIMFNQLDMSIDARFEGLSVTPMPPLATGAKYDLTLYSYTVEGRLRLTAVYDTARLDRDLARELLAAVSAALEALCGPDGPLDRVATLDWSGRDPVHRTIAPLDPVGALGTHAASRPDAVALSLPARDVTYRELSRRVEDLTGTLANELGVGTRALLLADRSAETVIHLLAALRAGLSVTVVDASEPEAWMDRAALVTASTAVIDPRSGLDDGRVRVVPGPAETPPGPTSGAQPDRSSNAELILLTSGTGALPRAVRSTTDPLYHYLGWAARHLGVTCDDRVAFVSGTGHDPMLRDVLQPIAVGATCAIPADDTLMDPEELAAWLELQRVSVLHLTPARARILSRARIRPLPDLRLVVFGGDRLAAADVEAVRALAPSVRVVNGYGATETPQLAAWAEVGTPALDPVPVGEGIDGTELVVVRDGCPVRPCELGEIVVRSRNLAEGYEGEDDDARFGPDPAGLDGVRAYRTGDVGRLLPNGDVLCLGRTDGLVVIRGHRVDPRQPESVLRNCPGVRDAIVVDGGRVGASLEGLLVSYVVTDTPVDAQELRTRLSRELPRHLVPHLIQELPAIPVTRNGKLDMTALPVPDRLQCTGRVPSTDSQRAVAAVWQEVLGIEVLDVDVGFFDLGGHSLQLVDLQQRLRSSLGLQIGIVDLYRRTTVASQAELVDAGTALETVGRPDAVDRARRRTSRRRSHPARRKRA